MSAAVHYNPNAGSFATSRRGGLTPAEIHEIEAHRAKDRPTPWSALARRYGRCEADVRALFDTPVKTEPCPEPVEKPIRKLFQWDEPQVSYLRARYGIDGPDAVAAMLGCSSIAAMQKASRLGIAQPRGWNRHKRAAAPLSLPPDDAPLSAPESSAPISAGVRQIILEIARKHGLTFFAIMAGRRSRCFSWPRQEAMAVLLDRKPHLTIPQVAAIFGLDRKTVTHGIEAHRARLEETRPETYAVAA